MQVPQESCENSFNTTVPDENRTSNDTRELSPSSSQDELHVLQDNEVANLATQLSSDCTVSSLSDTEVKHVKHNETVEIKKTDNAESSCANVEQDTVDSSQLNNVNRCTKDNKLDDNKHQAKKKVKSKHENVFESYIPVAQVINLLNTQKPDNIQYIKGNIRINPTNPKYAFVSMKSERDLLIIGTYNQNRALEGDLVVAKINSIEDRKNLSTDKVQKTGKVVCILKKVHPRTAIGVMRKQRIKNDTIIITPRDFKIPKIKVPLNSTNYSLCKQVTCNKILFVSIDSWEQNFPSGRILKIVGEVGEISAELRAIILYNNLDVSPYPKILLNNLPDKNHVLTNNDIKGREDWRHECIFTIDPATTIDIDDAISFKVLSNGNYEIGIHIADVTHYLQFLSPLDKAVSSRATTVYLPYTVYHMLPEVLCKICSLSADKDSLAFSVIFEMTPRGDVVKYRFAKTVIRSCCKMSYETVQTMIEDPERSWPEDSLDIKGDYTPSMISDAVNRLFEVATQLEDNRFANGALRLDLPKLRTWLDCVLNDNQENGILPKFYLEEFKDSNKLIKEFMLLTNETVARHLYEAIPKTSLLRIHRDPPKWRLQEVSNLLKQIGIHLDITTAGTLNSTIDRYYPEYNPACGNSMDSIMMAIMNMCSRSMLRAEYVCTSDILSGDLKHYALNMPLYTHFTSPIRRYADCIVHRLLYATITDKPLPKRWSAKLCSEIAFNCNVKKQSAKLAQDQSIEIIYAYTIGFSGSYKTKAIVMWLTEDKIDVLLCDTALKFKIVLKEVEGITSFVTDHSVDDDVALGITLTWNCPPSCEQIIRLFSFVTVKVEKVDKELRLKVTLLPPSEV